jgi:hypothetical protein
LARFGGDEIAQPARAVTLEHSRAAITVIKGAAMSRPAREIVMSKNRFIEDYGPYPVMRDGFFFDASRPSDIYIIW